MKLQTIVEITPPCKQISYENSRLLFIGSCFTENIGNWAASYKFPTVLNPCGIAYNPISAANTIAFITGNRKLEENDFILHNDLWHSWQHHGRFSHKDLATLQVNCEKEIVEGQKQLATASHIFLTLGTSWVFTHKKTAEIVNNCHKVAASEFEQRKLELSEVVETLGTAIQQIKKQNSTAEIIFTVSPVRHKKDGFHENQVSKAILLLAISKLQETYNDVGYFPAYEIVMDELRDYRFYAEDYCHLNSQGIQYIWERFVATYITPNSQAYFPQIKKLQQAIQHRVQDTDSKEYQNFRQKILRQIETLEQQLPLLDFSEEKKKFRF